MHVFLPHSSYDFYAHSTHSGGSVDGSNKTFPAPLFIRPQLTSSSSSPASAITCRKAAKRFFSLQRPRFYVRTKLTLLVDAFMASFTLPTLLVPRLLTRSFYFPRGAFFPFPPFTANNTFRGEKRRKKKKFGRSGTSRLLLPLLRFGKKEKEVKKWRLVPFSLHGRGKAARGGRSPLKRRRRRRGREGGEWNGERRRREVFNFSPFPLWPCCSFRESGGGREGKSPSLVPCCPETVISKSFLLAPPLPQPEEEEEHKGSP